MNNRQKAKHFKRLYERTAKPKRIVKVQTDNRPIHRFKIRQDVPDEYFYMTTGTDEVSRLEKMIRYHLEQQIGKKVLEELKIGHIEGSNSPNYNSCICFDIGVVDLYEE